MFLGYAAFRAARRALEEDQGRPRPCPLPFWRLLLGEIAVLVRRVGRWRVTAVVVSVFVAVLVVEVVASASPDSALASPWRWVGAAIIAVVMLVAWAQIHAVRAVRGSADRSAHASTDR